MYQSYDKNSDRPETGAKHVKTASFFIKTGFSFVKNSLQSRLRPGCTHHGDPGAGEVQTRVCVRSLRGCVDVYPPCWECFYVSFLHFVRQKRPFYYRKRPRFVDGHLGLNKCKQPIINHISKSASKKHDRCMMVE